VAETALAFLPAAKMRAAHIAEAFNMLDREGLKNLASL
jgi:hypothetical protein